MDIAWPVKNSNQTCLQPNCLSQSSHWKRNSRQTANEDDNWKFELSTKSICSIKTEVFIHRNSWLECIVFLWI